MRYPDHLVKLIQILRKFPGVGNKSAERFAFHLLTWTEKDMDEFGEMIKTTKDKLVHCSECGCLMGLSSCYYCDLTERDPHLLCVISSPKDLFAIEETGEYYGLYHVLGGLLSPLERKGPEQLSIQKLKERVVQLGIKEIVLALDSTLEGDATSLYLKQELGSLDLHISRLAFGLPMGSSLDYVDAGTLGRALSGRNQFK